jgi:hypothetical protein
MTLDQLLKAIQAREVGEKVVYYDERSDRYFTCGWPEIYRLFHQVEHVIRIWHAEAPSYLCDENGNEIIE